MVTSTLIDVRINHIHLHQNVNVFTRSPALTSPVNDNGFPIDCVWGCFAILHAHEKIRYENKINRVVCRVCILSGQYQWIVAQSLTSRSNSIRLECELIK